MIRLDFDTNQNEQPKKEDVFSEVEVTSDLLHDLKQIQICEKCEKVFCLECDVFIHS